MLSCYRQSFLFFLLQIIPAILSAQSTEVTFEGFYVQGSRMEHANIIFEDSFGFIWFGKANGLYKYDGYSLTYYHYDSDDSTSLSNNYVTAINEDKEGFLWVGTQDGLNRFNPATGQCRRFKRDPSNRASLSHSHITALCFDRSGAMWVGTSGGGLNVTERRATEKADHSDLHFKHFRHDPENPNSLSDDDVFCIAEDTPSNGEIIWIGTAHGLNAFYPQTQTFTRHLHDPNDARSLPYDQVWSLCQDREGDLWIGAGSGGLSKLNRNNSAEFRFTHFDLGKDVQVSTITEDRSNNLWIGTYHYCLFKYNTKTEELTHFKDDPNAINSFRSELIHSVMIDRAGTLWISCQSGIYKYDHQKEKLRQYAVGSSTPYTPGYRKISAICEDRENNLWLGAWGEGLVKFDLFTERFNIYAPPLKNHNNLRSPWIAAIHEDRNGLLWIGTVDGLECFDPKSKNFRHYGHNPADPNDPAKLSSNYISTIYEDSQGALWIGTARGVDQLNPRTGTFRHYLTDANNHISRIGYYVSALNEDDSGNLLIGGKGLFRLNHNTGELTRYFHHPNDSTGWISDLIECIHRDAGGELWIATDGNGLFRLRKDHPPLHLTEANGLPSNLVFGILEDAQGALWISTFKGMVSLNPDSNSIKRHAVADDWRSNEFRTGVFHKGRSGRFYFGNLRGFVTVLPQFMKDNPYVPPVRITAFKIFNQPVIFNRPFAKLDRLQLAHKQNMFSFDFVALNYTNSDKNQYAYKMEGFHEDWIRCGSERTALFMNLDPGNYVFKVKASNNDGLWNEEGASIKVIITPPWWKTRWAYASYASLFVTLVLGTIRFEVNRQKRKAEARLREEQERRKLDAAEHRAVVAELQAQAAEAQKEVEKEQMRRRIAGDLHDEIGSNLSSIAIISQMLEKKLKLAAPERQRLAEIPRIARATAESMRDIIWFINPENDSMEKLLVKMRQTANLMLESHDFAFRTPAAGMAFIAGVDFRRHLYLIYKEILQNIVKHAQATKVEIEICGDDKRLLLRVADNGVGFDVAGEYPGNGLKNFQRRAREMGGAVEVTSSPGNGTNVTLIVKIP
jgi:ligand-binding sensor domain-containing protein/signal transduction histidine kinase